MLDLGGKAKNKILFCPQNTRGLNVYLDEKSKNGPLRCDTKILLVVNFCILTHPNNLNP